MDANKKKAVIVLNTKKFYYHSTLFSLFGRELEKAGFELASYDLGSTKPEHEKYYDIDNLKPDLILSFDLSGFELRTENDTLSLNNFGCRIACLLFQPYGTYGGSLEQQMNFSMFLYTVRPEDAAEMKVRYPNIPNLSAVPGIEPDELFSSGARYAPLIQGWLESFRKEAEL